MFCHAGGLGGGNFAGAERSVFPGLRWRIEGGRGARRGGSGTRGRSVSCAGAGSGGREGSAGGRESQVRGVAPRSYLPVRLRWPTRRRAARQAQRARSRRALTGHQEVAGRRGSEAASAGRGADDNRRLYLGLRRSESSRPDYAQGGVAGSESQESFSNVRCSAPAFD